MLSKIYDELLDTTAYDEVGMNDEFQLSRDSFMNLSSIEDMKSKIEEANSLNAADVEQCLSIPFDEVRQQFADQYSTLGADSAHHAFFKRIPDTAKLINKVWIEHQGLQQDSSVTALMGRLSEDDPYNQRLFNMLKNRAVQI
mgnify:CR=1 FL=1